MEFSDEPTWETAQRPKKILSVSGSFLNVLWGHKISSSSGENLISERPEEPEDAMTRTKQEAAPLEGSHSHLPISAVEGGSTAARAGWTVRKIPGAVVALRAKPWGVTSSVTRCSPAGSRGTWQTSRLWLTPVTRQLLLLTSTCCSSPKPAPLRHTVAWDPSPEGI